MVENKEKVESQVEVEEESMQQEVCIQDTFNTDGLDILVEDGEVENVCNSDE